MCVEPLALSVNGSSMYDVGMMYISTLAGISVSGSQDLLMQKTHRIGLLLTEKCIEFNQK